MTPQQQQQQQQPQQQKRRERSCLWFLLKLLVFCFVGIVLVVACIRVLRFFESTIIEEDEVVVFFPTIVRFPNFESASDDNISIPIHGWIYETEHPLFPRQFLLDQLARFFNLTSQNELTQGISKALLHFQETVGTFFVNSEAGKRLPLSFCSRNYSLSSLSDFSGHFNDIVELTPSDFQRCIKKELKSDGKLQWVPISAHVTSSSDPKKAPKQYEGKILLVRETGLSVISDIDDTIKITEVFDRQRMLLNTFIKGPFVAVPSMSALYRRWQKQWGASYHYVSGSPWQLYSPLSRFLNEFGFPNGSIHLRLLDLSSPMLYKRKVIDPLIQLFPKRIFLLVGDSGELDPEIYKEVALEFPDQVGGVFIRDSMISANISAKERIEKLYEDFPPNFCVLFENPPKLFDFFVSPPISLTEQLKAAEAQTTN